MTADVVRQIDGWYSASGDHGVPPAVHIARLANIAWLKNPRAGSTLKQQELVALCSAALQPSERTWNAFVTHLRRLTLKCAANRNAGKRCSVSRNGR